MNRTRWFVNVNPALPGVYERQWIHGAKMQWPFYRWDGEQWIGTGSATPKDAAKETRRSVFQSETPWRGLAEDPAKVKPK